MPRESHLRTGATIARSRAKMAWDLGKAARLQALHDHVPVVDAAEQPIDEDHQVALGAGVPPCSIALQRFDFHVATLACGHSRARSVIYQNGMIPWRQELKQHLAAYSSIATAPATAQPATAACSLCSKS